MKKAIDLFGKALQDYQNGIREPFYLIDQKGLKDEHDLSRYFRPASKVSKLEKKLFELSTGQILDVGCGTANYFPAFGNMKVIGIDVSKRVVNIATKNGYDCIVADIFKYIPNTKFDTITFLENNLGMSGTPRKEKNLLSHIANLLNDNGQILAISRRVYFSNRSSILTPEYKGSTGTKFLWLHFSSRYLKRICSNLNLKLEIIDKNSHSNLYRITKI